MKTYRWTTDEGMEVKAELVLTGEEDGYTIEDWEVTLIASPEYKVDEVKAEQGWVRAKVEFHTSIEGGR